MDNGSGNAGASEQQLTAVESRLGIKLPPSYRAFLKASNGWRFAAKNTPILRAVEEIRWFRKEHKDWYEAYKMSAEPLCVSEKDYFDYAKQDCVEFEIKHLAQGLCISEIGDDAVVLLNPMVIWPDGEWETWFFSNSSPGATRFRSFADWMSQELNQNIGQTLTPVELPSVYLDPPAKPARRIRPREKPLVLEKVLKKFKSEKEDDRVKAVQQLGRIGGRQAVDALIVALNDPVNYVFWNAAVALGNLCPPEALDALIEAAADGVFGRANDNAISALGGYRDERSAQLLLKILERGGFLASDAARALARRGDVRAIEHLIHFLLLPPANEHLGGQARRTIDDQLKLYLSDDKGANTEQISQYAGKTISEFGEAGFAAIEPLMSHPNVTIRGRALGGISRFACCSFDKALRGKAHDLLKRCLETETDGGLRKHIKVSIENSARKIGNNRANRPNPPFRNFGFELEKSRVVFHKFEKPDQN